MSATQAPLFRLKNGTLFPGRTLLQMQNIEKSLFGEYGFLPAQICEAASYSMAMVVRYALGLSAKGGVVCVIVNDSFAGWTALATLRHLAYAGANTQLIFVSSDDAPESEELKRQLQPLGTLDIRAGAWSGEQDDQAVAELIDGAHNVICGLWDPTKRAHPRTAVLINMLNESKTPVHCIHCPLGIDPDSGKPTPPALYASSTLSLGAPFVGLYEASEFVGRHYLCDISISPALYQTSGVDLSELFAEQPVTQIFPAKPKEEDQPPAAKE